MSYENFEKQQKNDTPLEKNIFLLNKGVILHCTAWILIRKPHAVEETNLLTMVSYSKK